jgi:hypothetical protein
MSVAGRVSRQMMEHYLHYSHSRQCPPREEPGDEEEDEEEHDGDEEDDDGDEGYSE